jgi:hypothetical protein
MLALINRSHYLPYARLDKSIADNLANLCSYKDFDVLTACINLGFPFATHYLPYARIARQCLGIARRQCHRIGIALHDCIARRTTASQDGIASHDNRYPLLDVVLVSMY